MSTQSPEPEVPIRRTDRILAFTALGIAAASVICFFAIIIGTATGMEQEDFGSGAWPTVSAIVWIAPPIAFALLLTVLIMTFIRRGRANKGR